MDGAITSSKTIPIDHKTHGSPMVTFTSKLSEKTMVAPNTHLHVWTLLVTSQSFMENSKWEQNYLKVKASGPLSGFSVRTSVKKDGPLAERSTSWNSLEEILEASTPLFMLTHTTLLEHTNTLRVTAMTSTPMLLTGNQITSNSSLMVTTITPLPRLKLVVTGHSMKVITSSLSLTLLLVATGPVTLTVHLISLNNSSSITLESMKLLAVPRKLP